MPRSPAAASSASQRFAAITFNRMLTGGVGTVQHQNELAKEPAKSSSAVQQVAAPRCSNKMRRKRQQ